MNGADPPRLVSRLSAAAHLERVDRVVDATGYPVQGQVRPAGHVPGGDDLRGALGLTEQADKDPLGDVGAAAGQPAQMRGRPGPDDGQVGAKQPTLTQAQIDPAPRGVPTR